VNALRFSPFEAVPLTGVNRQFRSLSWCFCSTRKAGWLIRPMELISWTMPKEVDVDRLRAHFHSRDLGSESAVHSAPGVQTPGAPPGVIRRELTTRPSVSTNRTSRMIGLAIMRDRVSSHSRRLDRVLGIVVSRRLNSHRTSQLQLGALNSATPASMSSKFDCLRQNDRGRCPWPRTFLIEGRPWRPLGAGVY